MSISCERTQGTRHIFICLVTIKPHHHRRHRCCRRRWFHTVFTLTAINISIYCSPPCVRIMSGLAARYRMMGPSSNSMRSTLMVIFPAPNKMSESNRELTISFQRLLLLPRLSSSSCTHVCHCGHYHHADPGRAVVGSQGDGNNQHTEGGEQGV